MAHHRQPSADRLLHTARVGLLATVRDPDTADLSLRQLSVLLTVSLEPGPHTVRGLAAELNVSKPAITRALDRLGELDFVRRNVDPMDRRSVFAVLQPRGREYVAQLRHALDRAAQIESQPRPSGTREHAA